MRRTNLIKVGGDRGRRRRDRHRSGGLTVANAAGGPNLALGKPTSASTTNGRFVAGNLNDGNQGTYWESADNAFPQWAQVDLGASHQHRPGRAEAAHRLGHPYPDPVRAGQHRTASSFTTIVASAGLQLQPGHQQRGDDQLPRDLHPVRAGQHHREHRLGRRAAVRARGLRRRQLDDQPRAGPPDHRERPRRRLRRRGNAVDGNQATYWESVNNSFPQWAHGRPRRVA